LTDAFLDAIFMKHCGHYGRVKQRTLDQQV